MRLETSQPVHTERTGLDLKISVVIPVRNGARTLPRTFESILTQTYRNFEVIVIDGKSIDGTVDTIKAYEQFINFWVSEEDAGTSDAMNKGVRAAQGDLITILMADDRLADKEIFARVAEAFRVDPDLDIVFSAVKMEDPQRLIREEVIPSDPADLYHRVGTHLPGAFFKRTSLDFPMFDLSYKVANDYELMCRLLIRRGLRCRVFPEYHVIMSMGGLSSDPKYGIRHVWEKFRIRRYYFGPWLALRIALIPFSTAILRRLHFRPYSWARKIRRRIKGIGDSS